VDEAALLPGNILAVHIWERWKVFGALALELLDLELTPYESSLLLEQLYFLDRYSAYLDALQREGR
jgi:hypothetical protein